MKRFGSVMTATEYRSENNKDRIHDAYFDHCCRRRSRIVAGHDRDSRGRDSGTPIPAAQFRHVGIGREPYRVAFVLSAQFEGAKT